TAYSVTNQAAGRNRIDYWFQQFTDGTTTDVAIAAIQDLPGDANLVTDEAFLQYYDSGAPLLMELDGILTLIGINWFKVDNFDVDPRPLVKLRNISGFSYVGNYAAPIQAIIDAYRVDATAGFLVWRSATFGSDSDLALGGPAIDSDLDGLLNFTEYAFVTDPLSGAHPAPVSSRTTELDGMDYLEAVFSARDDPDLQYFVNVGGNLLDWTRVDLLFNGSFWTTSDSLSLSVFAASALGDGVWQLTVRVPAPLVPGNPSFLAPGVE
ncbi:MAG TPA: hypothetical protein VK995_03755, partial [Oceanipulchritudo sp.]|nr:hypothetical protein [Oceanipulchritudo sp.]